MPEEKILYISYLFPPGGGVGVPRAVSYTRNLPKHGFEVFVVAPSHPATPVVDYGLLKLIPPDTRMHRAFNPAVPYAWRDKVWKRLLGGSKAAQHAAPAAAAAPVNPLKAAVREAIQRIACPDVQRFWAPFAIRKAKEVIRQHGIRTAIVNTPPFSMMQVAIALKREFPDIRLIMEIRDDWLGYYFLHFDTAADSYKRRFAERTEREAIRLADYVVGVTPTQSAQIRRRYPDQPDSKFLCVPNGFDPDLFSKVERKPHTPGRLVLTYFGSVYANPVYSPKTFLDAVDALPPEFRDRLEVRFIGRIAVEAQPLFENRKANIRQLGFMPQQEIVKHLADTDYLLLIVDDATAHAGKLFDYLGTRIPVLALTPPEGEIGRMIARTRSGWSAPANSESAIQHLLNDAFARAERGERTDPDWDAILDYSWPRLVASLLTSTGLRPAPATAQPAV